MVIANGDRRATNHYWREEDMTCLKNIIRAVGPNITLPNNSVLKSDQQGYLLISSKLSKIVQQATVLPHLKSSSLILGQLCDDSCNILLVKKM